MPLPQPPYLYTTSAQKEYPTGDGVEVITTAGSFSNSLWVEVIAATPDTWYLTGLSVICNTGGLGMTEFDIGLWNGASYDVVGTLQHNQSANAVLPLTIPGAWIPSGGKVGVRLRCATTFAGFSFFCALLYYEGTPAGRVATSLAHTSLSVSSGGTALLSSVTPWLAGDWEEISASIPTEWVIAAVQITPIDVIGSVPVQMEIEIGIGASVPTPIVATTIRWSSVMINTKSPTVLNVWPMYHLPSATQVWARLRTSDSQAVTVRVQLVVLNSSAGLSTVITTQPTEWFPPAATSLALTTPSNAWVNGAYVQVAALTTSIGIVALAVDGCPTSAENSFDLAIGPVNDGTQDVVATFRFGEDQITAIGSDHTQLTLHEPQLVQSGEILWVRARSSSATGRTLSCAVGHIVNPTFAQLANNPQQEYIPNANGASLATSATPWSNSAWGVVKTSTASDILITGVSMTNESSAMVSVDIGTGAASSEAVITMAKGYTMPLTNLWFALPTPHYVPMGSRVSVRYRKTGASTGARLIGLTYLGLPTGPAPPEPFETVTRRIRRQRTAPHLWDGASSRRMTYHDIELLYNSGEGVMQVSLELSRDSGHTWGPLRIIDAGRVGQYLKRAVWHRNGQARDLVVRITESNDAQVTFLDVVFDPNPEQDSS